MLEPPQNLFEPPHHRLIQWLIEAAQEQNRILGIERKNAKAIDRASSNTLDAVAMQAQAIEQTNESVAQVTDTAWTALASADGKTTNYYSDVEPEEDEELGVTFKDGDTWFDTANDNRISIWRVTFDEVEEEYVGAWELVEFGAGAIADLAVTNAKIADATIQSAKIAELDAGKITTGTLSADRIGANTITTTKLAATAIDGMTITGVTVQASQFIGRDASNNPAFLIDGATGVVTGYATFLNEISGREMTRNIITGDSWVKDGSGLVVPYDAPTKRYRIIPAAVGGDLVFNDDEFNELAPYATIESGHVCLHGRLTAKSNLASQAVLVGVHPGLATSGNDDVLPTGTKLSANSIRFVVGATVAAGNVTVWWDPAAQQVKVIGALTSGQFVQLDGVRIPIDYS